MGISVLRKKRQQHLIHANVHAVNTPTTCSIKCHIHYFAAHANNNIQFPSRYRPRKRKRMKPGRGRTRAILYSVRLSNWCLSVFTNQAIEISDV